VLNPFLDEDERLGPEDKEDLEIPQLPVDKNPFPEDKEDLGEIPQLPVENKENVPAEKVTKPPKLPKIEDGILSGIRALQDLPAAQFLKFMQKQTPRFLDTSDLTEPSNSSDDYGSYLADILGGNSPRNLKIAQSNDEKNGEDADGKLSEKSENTENLEKK